MAYPPDVARLLAAWAHEMGQDEAAIVSTLVRFVALTVRMQRLPALLQTLQAAVSRASVESPVYGTRDAVLLTIVNSHPRSWAPRDIVRQAAGMGVRLKSTSVSSRLGKLARLGVIVKQGHGAFTRIAP